jgi:hypothetical protein
MTGSLMRLPTGKVPAEAAGAESTRLLIWTRQISASSQTGPSHWLTPSKSHFWLRRSFA